MAETTQPHVLLVDDSTVYLTLADILFAEMAVTLVVAQGGWAALAACERQPFDLILMDLQRGDASSSPNPPHGRPQEGQEATKTAFTVRTTYPRKNALQDHSERF